MTEAVSDSEAAVPLDLLDAAELMRRAVSARGNAYAPYSGFSVGAALLGVDGRVHTGTNVENASFGLTICAERAALFAAVAAGARSFRAVAIAGPDEDAPCPPCGACRQVLHEFAPSLTIVVAAHSGEVRMLSLAQLLPEAFSPGVTRSQSFDNDGPDRRPPAADRS